MMPRGMGGGRDYLWSTNPGGRNTDVCVSLIKLSIVAVTRRVAPIHQIQDHYTPVIRPNYIH